MERPGRAGRSAVGLAGGAAGRLGWRAVAPWVGRVLACALATGAPTSPVAAQVEPTGFPVVLRDADVSPDTVEIGDRFEVRFVLELPEGTVAFLPDSLDAGPVESVGPVRWTARTGERGSRALSVVYPMMALRTGLLPVPSIDLFVGAAAHSVAAGLSSPGDPVGSWSAFRDEPAAVPSARLLTLPRQRIQAATVLSLDDTATAIVPRPPADVSGADRDWLSTFFVAAFGLLLATVVTASARDWASTRRRGSPDPAPTPRDDALAALDRILASGLHHDGQTRAFYAAWSAVVRRYIEGFSPRWGPAWTSSELMSDLQSSGRGLAAGREVSPEALAEEMMVAERVKFGGWRPDPSTAEKHLRRARAWIEESAELEGGPVAEGHVDTGDAA